MVITRGRQLRERERFRARINPPTTSITRRRLPSAVVVAERVRESFDGSVCVCMLLSLFWLDVGSSRECGVYARLRL